MPETKLVPKNAEQRAWLKDREKYPSGFCNEHGKPGQHEGQKPRSFKGAPMKTCPFWQTCPCECHWNVDQLFVMTGMERREVPNPEYTPPVSEFVMPDFIEDPLGDIAATGSGVIGPDGVEQPYTVPSSPAAAPLAQRRTDTGRAARGGLEAQVWDACFNMPGEDDLTPKQVGEWIAEKYKVPTPSSGAINAVWDRWERLEFATQAKKPNRFTGFCKEGTWEELARMKGSAKRQKKSASAVAARTIRPRGK